MHVWTHIHIYVCVCMNVYIWKQSITKHTCVWSKYTRCPHVPYSVFLSLKLNLSCHPTLRKGSLSYTSDSHKGLPVAAPVRLLRFCIPLHLRKPLPLAAQKWLNNWSTSRFSIYSRWKIRQRRQMALRIWLPCPVKGHRNTLSLCLPPYKSNWLSKSYLFRSPVAPLHGYPSWGRQRSRSKRLSPKPRAPCNIFWSNIYNSNVQALKINEAKHICNLAPWVRQKTTCLSFVEIYVFSIKAIAAPRGLTL